MPRHGIRKVQAEGVVPRFIGEEGGSGRKGHFLGDCLRYRLSGVRCPYG
jgi:hypothetical protein